MRFSRSLKSSAHSLPSPDGAFIATVLPSKLNLRRTRSLEIYRVIPLPPDLYAHVQYFSWSQSSNKLLLATADTIRVYSSQVAPFTAIITNPTSGTAKVTSVSFGATDDEICVFSDFGLKLTVFHLSTSTSIDIPCPKLYSSISFSKGLVYRPQSLNAALLTRNNGKDIVSIHARKTYEIIRSWSPDTVDAQSLHWSPDGKWLAISESSGQGHKILFYTADGHLFKVWKGPIPNGQEEKDIVLGAGVKLVEWNSTADYIAVGDFSSTVTLLSSPSFAEAIRLRHTTTIKPVTGLQIWQEQVVPSLNGGFTRDYALACQITCPPTTVASPNAGDSGAKSGTNIIFFDMSGTLVVTKCENMPTAVWIWDIASKVLRAVLIEHAPVAKVTWHPTVNELLMIRCEGEESKGLVHLWEPTWEAPKILDFGTQLPENKIIGRSIVRWLNCDTPSPALFFSDTQDCLIGVFTESEYDEVPWQDAVVKAVDIYGQLEESPLNLVGVDDRKLYDKIALKSMIDNEPTITAMSGGSEGDVDDTFRFRKFMDP